MEIYFESSRDHNKASEVPGKKTNNQNVNLSSFSTITVKNQIKMSEGLCELVIEAAGNNAIDGVDIAKENRPQEYVYGCKRVSLLL